MHKHLTSSSHKGTCPLCASAARVCHLAFSKSIALLRECGVRVLHEPERYPSPLMVPRNQVLETLREIIPRNGEAGGS